MQLRGQATRQFATLEANIKTDWNLLLKTWCELYPPPITLEHEEEDAELFYELCLNVNKLSSLLRKPNGDITWEIAEFTDLICCCSSKITSLPDEAKGMEIYRHLPSIIKDELPKYKRRGNMIEPKLSTLCTDLLNLNFHDIAHKLKNAEAAAQQTLSLQKQLNALKLQRRPSANQYLYPTSALTPSNVANSTTPVIMKNPFPQQNPPPSQNSVPNVKPKPRIVFNTTPEGRRSYEEAVQAWNTMYGPEMIPDHNSCYPLTPRTLSPGSGECWHCRTCGHKKDSSECLCNPALPEKEQAYCTAVGTRLRATFHNINYLTTFHIESGTFNDFVNLHVHPEYNAQEEADPYPDNLPGNGYGDDA